jgi:hypothetical protein
MACRSFIIAGNPALSQVLSQFRVEITVWSGEGTLFFTRYTQRINVSRIAAFFSHATAESTGLIVADLRGTSTVHAHHAYSNHDK